jgi:hypothetical protein
VSFGVSTQFQSVSAADRDLLVDIAAHGFDRRSLALASHFDHRDRAAIDTLGNGSMTPSCGCIRSIRPSRTLFFAGWRDTITIGASDEAARNARWPKCSRPRSRRHPAPRSSFHCSVPAPYGGAGENRASVRRRSKSWRRRRQHGVRIAGSDSQPDVRSDGARRAHRERLELPNIGICMDVGTRG